MWADGKLMLLMSKCMLYSAHSLSLPLCVYVCACVNERLVLLFCFLFTNNCLYVLGTSLPHPVVFIGPGVVLLILIPALIVLCKYKCHKVQGIFFFLHMHNAVYSETNTHTCACKCFLKRNIFLGCVFSFQKLMSL